MNRETPPSPAVARWIDAWVRLFEPGPGASTEADLLKHFPFARTPEAPAPRSMHMPANAHGTH